MAMKPSDVLVPIATAVIGAAATLLSTDNAVSRWISSFIGQAHGSLFAIQGSVMLSDPDPEKRYVLRGVKVTDTDNPELAAGPVMTDESGYFRLPLKPSVKSGDAVSLQLASRGYQTWTMHATAGDGVPYTIYLWPTLPGSPQASIPHRASFVEVAYAPPEDNRTETFLIPNQGSIPCNRRQPCSPDGKWKANRVTSPPLDAGQGNVFLSGHAECIAGPCPWTRIEDPNGVPKTGQRTMTVTVLNWSDTATYRLSGVAGHP